MASPLQAKESGSGRGGELTGNELACPSGCKNLKRSDDIVTDEYLGDSISSSYRLKSELFIKAYSEIGMGRYQWEMFLVAGLGWLVNNLMAQGVSSALLPVDMEFNPPRVTYATVAYFTGSAIGSGVWGIISDVIGRRLSFNITLYWTAIFCTIVGGANNFITFAALQSLIGIGAGGNVSVDIVILLECLPATHHWLTMGLYVWWLGGQVVASLVSWVYLANFSCPTNTLRGECSRAENMGWRYTTITLGLLTLLFAIVRMLIFRFPESTQYLLSVGRDEDAIAALTFIAARNGKPPPLAIADLELVDPGCARGASSSGPEHPSAAERAKRSLTDFKLSRILALFSTRKMGFQVALLWTISTTIGIAYALYFNFIPSYLASKFTTDTSLEGTYRKYCIVSAVGVSGPLAGCFLIETRFGRKWMMAISFTLAGVFLYLYTTAQNAAADLGFQCVVAIFGNLGLATLCVITPESFPAPYRGTGNGISYFLQYFSSVFAPIIAANTGLTTAPIYSSAGLWFLCVILACALPLETRKSAAL